MVKRMNKNIGNLFLTFLKIGAFTFGGGYAMIPLIQKEVVEEKQWITQEDIFEIIAIAESTPGPIAINAATFVGYKICGFRGALAATCGVAFPSFLIISIISFGLQQFEHVKAVQYAFNGIRAGVLALIIKALISMYQQCPKKIVSYVIIAMTFIFGAFSHVSVLLLIIVSALLGLLIYMIEERRHKR